MNKLYLLLCVAQLGHAMSLHDACRQGDVSTVKRILQEDANQLNERKNSLLPIHDAAYGACPEVVKILLDVQPDSIDQVESQGNTPFNYIFIAVLDLQKKEEEFEIKVREGRLSRVPDSFTNAKPARIQHFKDTIALFIERRANVDKLNNFACGWQCLDRMALADYARCLILIKEEESN